MRKLMILMLLCGVSFACSDKDPVGPLPGAKKGIRVKTIKGSDSHWGDYTMDVQYHLNAVDSIIINNAAGEKIGHVYNTDVDNVLTYRFIDLVVNMTQEQIDELIAEHGEEEAKKRIPIVERTYRTFATTYYRDQISSQTFTYYRPKENTGGTFDTRYELDYRNHYAYEFDGSGRLVICRTVEDVYDHSLGENYFDRMILKYDVNYSGGNVQSMTVMRAEGDQEIEANYLPYDNYTFTYTSGILTTVTGDKLNMSYVNTGVNPTSITADGETTTYKYNGYGLPTHITYADGSYMEITYEEGEGNMDLFSSILDRLFNIPGLE